MMMIVMRIGSINVLLLCLTNLVRIQTESLNGDSEVPGDSEWWSKRITRINKIRPTELVNEDTAKQDGEWSREDTRQSVKQSHELATFPSRYPKLRDGFESQREHFRDSEDVETVEEHFDWKRLAPSPILLPPYGSFNYADHATRSSNSRVNDVKTIGKKNQSTHVEKSFERSSDRSQFHRITKLNSSIDDKLTNKQNYDGHSSDDSTTSDENLLADAARKTSVNSTKIDGKHVDGHERDFPVSFYINESRDAAPKMRPENFTTIFRRKNHSVKYSRGSTKYHREFRSDGFSGTKKSFETDDKYDWPRRYHSQPSNHFKFNTDSNWKAGAVPGVPGRDYPVHQEHTHHNLRNVAERFPCPRTPKTHVYLADRPSRCQIFYVCYGSKTGVPMVCPNGTLFSEPLQVCDWWFNVSC